MNGLFKVRHKKYGYKYMIYDIADDSGDIYFLMYIGGEWVFRWANDYEPIEDEEND